MKIGLEVHVQLNTKTKLFCGCPNSVPKDAQGASAIQEKPNVHVCEYCIGMPGSKPRVNKKAIDYAIMIGHALDCKINSPTFFSRKAYFYPDMGKNFQITQYEVPVASGGIMKLGPKKITIKRIQIEEDPARLVHVGGGITTAQYVLMDYNRSGTPLVEIVTEPDFESPKEARDFLQKLSSILQYLGVYDPDVEGSMRVDANVSVGSVRVEIKNITGFKEVERALSYEIIRQKNAIRRNSAIARETRAWDADANVTRSLRSKEQEEDYGYIFEGDLPSFSFGNDMLAHLRAAIPELPDQKAKRYGQMKINQEIAEAIVSEPDLANMFEKVIEKIDTQLAAKWFAGDIKKTLNYNNLHVRNSKLTAGKIIRLLSSVQNKEITDHTAEMMLRDMTVKEVQLDDLGHSSRIHDEKILEKAIQEVLGTNSKAVLDYKSGKTESFNFLVGQVMRKTQGRGDSDTIRRLLKKLI